MLSDVVFCQSSGLSRCKRGRGEVTTLNRNMWFLSSEHLSSGLIWKCFQCCRVAHFKMMSRELEQSEVKKIRVYKVRKFDPSNWSLIKNKSITSRILRATWIRFQVDWRVTSVFFDEISFRFDRFVCWHDRIGFKNSRMWGSVLLTGESSSIKILFLFRCFSLTKEMNVLKSILFSNPKRCENIRRLRYCFFSSSDLNEKSSFDCLVRKRQCWRKEQLNFLVSHLWKIAN